MIHPIEQQSYKILTASFDFSDLSALDAVVVKRIIHATADFEFARSVKISAGAIEKVVKAIAAGVDVICDVEMVKAGISKYSTQCYLDRAVASPTGYPTRSYTAMNLAAREHPQNSIFVVGCAPTALEALVELNSAEWFNPVLIIGLPVGFGGAAEWKMKLSISRFPFITNVGTKGGSPAASAAFNSLCSLSKEDLETKAGHDES